MKKLTLAVVLSLGLAFSANAADKAAQQNQKGKLSDGKAYEMVGNSLFILDAHGNKQPAADGTYTLADGTTVTTKGGQKVEDAANGKNNTNNVKKASEAANAAGNQAAPANQAAGHATPASATKAADQAGAGHQGAQGQHNNNAQGAQH